MLTVFDDLINELTTMNIEAVLMDSIGDDEKISDYIADLQKNQFKAGENNVQADLGVYASKTVSFNASRQTKISAGETIKLKDTGKLYDSIDTEYQNKEIIIKYNKERIESLETKLYPTDSLIGLHDESYNKLSSFIPTTGQLQQSILDNIKL